MIIPIVHKGRRRYALVSKKTGRVLGTHKTLAEAKAQEHAVNMSKARAAGYRLPPPPKRSRHRRR
jgi:hypothetical protein